MIYVKIYISEMIKIIPKMKGTIPPKKIIHRNYSFLKNILIQPITIQQTKRIKATPKISNTNSSGFATYSPIIIGTPTTTIKK